MKFITGIIFGILLVLQAPVAWEAYQKSRQCDESLAKQLSDNLAKAHPDLDVIDCSFAHFYVKGVKAQLRLH